MELLNEKKFMKDHYASTVKVEINQSSIINNNKNKTIKRALIQCLDISGSMYGCPIEAVKKGAIKVGHQFLKSSTFSKLLTIKFNQMCINFKFKSLEQYEEKCLGMRADGGTDFSCVFDKILCKYREKYYSKYRDLTIVFMTDGLTDSNKALKSLEKLNIQ